MSRIYRIFLGLAMLVTGSLVTATSALATNNCLANPHVCGYPDSTNTGVPAGATLTNSGSITAVANQVIDAKNVSGTIYIAVAHVTVKRTKVTSSSAWPVQVTDAASDVLIQDVEINGSNSSGSVGIGWANFTCTRCNIHGSEDGVRAENNVIIQDSWIHGQSVCGSCHSDSFQSTGGSNDQVKHSTLSCADNSAIILKTDQAAINNVTIDNILADCGNYTFYSLDGFNGYGSPTNVTVENSRFGTHYTYGVSDYDFAITQHGNVWDATGASLTL